MPIRPENRARYPRDWPAIADRIRARAGNCCECLGQCGDVHPGGRCNAPNRRLVKRDEQRPEIWRLHDGCSLCLGGDPECRPVLIVLTVAHFDHTPENCDDANLFAGCQRCHLKYDAKHHAATARATRRSFKAYGELF